LVGYLSGNEESSVWGLKKHPVDLLRTLSSKEHEEAGGTERFRVNKGGG